MNTTGNTILITGGTSGIGLAFAEEFLRLGNTVIICGRRKKRLDEIKAKHKEIITIVSDVEVAEQREGLVQWTLENYPQLNFFFNNAGVQLTADLTQPIQLDRIRSEIETNLVAPIHLASLLSHPLATKKDAAIFNISSGLAFCPLAFMPVYCATKAAMHSWTLSLRYQLRKTSVKVFEIIPPSVDTELGHERRVDKTQTHGGIPVTEFLAEAMEAIHTDRLEATVGQSRGLRAKGEELFEAMNGRVG